MRGITSHLFSIYLRFPYARQMAWSAIVMVFLSCVFVLFLTNRKTETVPVGWERSFPLSPAGMDAQNMQVASRGSFVAVVYEGNRGDEHRIYATLSFNGGASFLPAQAIADVDPTLEHHPSVGVSGLGHVAVVWQNLVAEDSSTRIFMSLSTDMGASWTAPSRIYLDSDMELLPRIIYDDKNNLHLFYHGSMKNRFMLSHAISSEGVAFRKPERLSIAADMRGAFFPAVLAEGSVFFMVWQGKSETGGFLTDDLYFMKSGNYGRSWTRPVKITTSRGNDASPSLALYRETLYCVYQNNDDRNWAIKLLRGYEYGDRWDAAPENVSLTNANCFSPMVLSGRSDELIMLWYDTREVAPGVMARKYYLTDRNFSAESMLSQARRPARKPLGLTVGSRVIALWEETGRIIAKYSDIYAEPPVVYSRTHPENEWSRQPAALIEWRPEADESGIAGYAVIQNRDPDFIPTVQNLEKNVRSYRITYLDDGVTYFHIRAVDGAGNFSRTIHYRMQVSRNPLPMPVVVSATHPEAKVSTSRSPVFTWSLDEMDRLKGFMYSIGRNRVERPDTFTRDFEARFDNLPDGRWFFALEAIDKTNAGSRVATYEIIVNRADAIDKTIYERYARGEVPSSLKVPVTGAAPPSLAVVFPFDTNRPYDGNSFEALIVPRNIRPDMIDGYSLIVEKTRMEPPGQVNYKSSVIRLSELRNGAYHISVSARYVQIVNGRKTLSWTKPAYAGFAVQVSEPPSAVVLYAREVIKRVERHRLPLSISLMGAVLSIITVGFGTRLSFLARLINFRIRAIFGMEL